MSARGPNKGRVLDLGVAEVEARLSSFSAQELSSLVARANEEYWEHNDPTLPDPLYDRLVEQLRRLDPTAPILEDLGGRAPRGAPLAAKDALEADPGDRFGAAVEHESPMLSLGKVYADEDLADWAKKIEGDFLVMPKLDGVACSIRFRDGRLVIAATRGSGTIGEDVTMNVLKIPGVPATLPSGAPEANGDLEVRGEIYMKLSAFKAFADEYMNPRNLTAGSLKNKDPANDRTHALTLGAYDLVGSAAQTEQHKFARLKALGLPTVDHSFEGPDRLAAAYEELAAKRPDLDYEIDGVVYRADLVSEQTRLGATGHHPRFAIAYKFQGDTGETTLIDILWSVSRSGTITPVARLNPVELSGAMISRVSLHNLNRFRDLDLRPGARVEVTRRGGVIPYIERALDKGKGDPFRVPALCPACASSTEVRQKRDGEFLQCTNARGCVVAKLRELEHFTKVVDMQGFGPKVITQLADAELLSTPADLYRLRVSDIEGLERLGRKSAQNLVDQVDAHRTMALPTFLEALGVEHLGKQNALLLAGEFGDLTSIREVKNERLVEIKGVKEAIAEAITAGLRERAELIDALLEFVTVEPYAAPVRDVPDDAPMLGMSFVFTGTLEAFDRKTAADKARALGAETPSGVSKTLTHLVVGAGKGAKSSKQKKAEKLIEAGAPIKIIPEASFLAMISGSSSE